jgi:protein involved in polysaccharide export with SLBB domain
MAGRRFAGFVSASFCAFALLYPNGLVRAQPASKEKPPPAEAAKAAAKKQQEADLRDPVKRKALIDKMLAEYDLTPHPMPSIPENPPPHEGALISLPYVLEPPDLILVELIEGLPGRPISGERLVRPNGTICLGWYGDISVRGLSLPQIKVAIIKHLRQFLTDEQLGLETMEGEEPPLPAAERPALPMLPGGAKPFDLEETPKPVKKTSRATSPRSPFGGANRRMPSQHLDGRRVPVRAAAMRGTNQDAALAPEAQKPPPSQIVVPAGASGRITITIDFDGAGRPVAEQVPPSPFPPVDSAIAESGESWKIVSPEESYCVFVDVTAYNSNKYTVLGDVGTPGVLPHTGGETVLDALQYANGLISTADPKQVTLVRPQRNGKPARIYKVDLEGIQERGEVATNYQVFPGDRLVVGRNDVVKKTVEIDRLNAPIQTMTSMMLQEAFMLRALQMVSIDHRDELLKEYVDFWAKELSRSSGVKFDEQTLRDAFIRKMKLIPAPVPANPSR